MRPLGEKSLDVRLKDPDKSAVIGDSSDDRIEGLPHATLHGDSGQTLIGEIWQHQPGDKVSITYTRDGSTHTANVTLGSRTGDSN